MDHIIRIMRRSMLMMTLMMMSRALVIWTIAGVAAEGTRRDEKRREAGNVRACVSLV